MADDFLERQLQEAADLVAKNARDTFFDRISKVCQDPASATESPLEMAWLVWWNALIESVRVACSDRPIPTIEAQVEVEACGSRYRLDFALRPGKVAVELDGHEFHERTKEQVERRNKRDRDLQAEGWIVLHYSFSTFVRGQVACLVEAIEAWERQQPTGGQQ